MTVVTLPIETKVRELDGKLWLSLHLVRAGATVYLGPDHAINGSLGEIQPDVHLLNSAYENRTYRRAVETVRSYGGRIAVLDTEGGIYRSRDAYALRLSPSLLKDVDVFLAWGHDPAQIVRETAAAHGLDGPEVIVSGNPSFDLLQSPGDGIFEPEAAELRQQLGRFILVNTNFGYANPFTRDTVNQRTETPERRQMEELLFARVITLVKRLAATFPTTQVVLRPHPSENHATYSSHFEGVPNLHVIHRGPVTPWLKASAVLVHNVCTTGVEAAVLGKPVLAFCPTPAHMDEHSVANMVSERVSDEDRIVERVRECLDAPADVRVPLPEERLDFLRQYIANVGFSASESITKAFLAAPPLHGARLEPSRPDLRTRLLRAIVRVGGERTLDRVRAMRGASNRTQIAYVRQKFPGLALPELEARIARMAAAEPTLANVRVRKVGGLEHTFVLEPARGSGIRA